VLSGDTTASPHVKVEVDPSIPMKLLFLLNASSHEKIESERHTEFKFAQGDTRAVGDKLREMMQNKKIDVNADNTSQAKQYIVDELTEMDLVKNNTIIGTTLRKDGPPQNAGVDPKKESQKRLITF
jgi:hypothetical protein